MKELSVKETKVETREMKFGFVIHPITGKQLIAKARNIGTFSKMLSSLNFWGFLQFYHFPKWFKRENNYLPPQVLYTYDNVTSPTGVSVSGKIVGIMMSPKQILEDQQLALKMIRKSYQSLEKFGVEILGLGALTGIIGSNGEMIDNQVSAAVTTGDCFMVYTSVKILERALEKLGIHLPLSTVAIIGFPGRVGTAIARMLASKGANLNLIGRVQSKPVQQLRFDLMKTYGVAVELRNDLTDVLQTQKIIVSASSREGIINQNELSSGSVVIDVSLPKNVIGVKAERDDILVIDGGIVSLPMETNCKHDPFGIGKNNILACLAEAIILALEHRKESFSIGRRLELDKIEEIGLLGEKHGFIVKDLISFDRVIPQKIFSNVRSIVNQQ